MTESATEGSENKGIENGTTTGTVTVSVVDNNDGTLTATATSTEEKPLTFTNTYKVRSATVDFPVKKVVTSETADTAPGAWSYDFTLTDSDKTEVETVTISGTGNTSGTKTYEELTFDKPGTYTYTVTESATEGSENKGIENGTTTGTVTVSVVDNNDGTLTATATSTEEKPLTFTNTYKVTSTKTSFPVKKVLDVPKGLDGPEAWSYKIDVEAVDGAPQAETMTGTVSKTADTVTFGDFTYTAPGTYTYKVTESGKVDGVTNDAAAETGKTVTVTVIDNHDGTLTATPNVSTTDPLTFTNVYKVKPTTASFPVVKDLVVPANLEGPAKWSYTIDVAANGTAPEPSPASQTINQDTENKTVTFGPITYTAPGFYVYTVTETGEIDGVTNDAAAASGKTVRVLVVDKGNGQLEASVRGADSTDEEVTNTTTFTNNYNTEPKVFETTAMLSKTVVKMNPNVESETFDFALTLGTNDAKDADGKPIATPAPMLDGEANYEASAEFTKDNETQAIDFGKITFTAPGKYNYTVTEDNADLLEDGWTTTGNPANITIEVTDNGDGTLNAVVLNENGEELENGAVITNTYPVTTVKANKVWNDNNNHDKIRDKVNAKFQLYKTVGEGEDAKVSKVGEAVAVSDADGWSKTWENLPVYENDTQIVYSVEEELPANSKYTQSGGGASLPAVADATEETTITNSHQSEPEKTEFTVDNKTIINGEEVQPGQVLTFKISYTNTTGETLDEVTISDIIPAHTKYEEGSYKVVTEETTAGVTPSSSSDADGVKWVFKDVKDGTKITVSFQVKVDEDTGGAPIENTGEVKDGKTDPKTNTMTNPTPTLPVKEVYKGEDEYNNKLVKEGEELTYKVTYKNTTGKELDTVTITDPLPDNVLYVGNSATPADKCTTQPADQATTGDVVWEFSNVADGDEITVSFKVKVAKNNGVKIDNTAYAEVPDHEPYATNKTHNPTPKDPEKEVAVEGKTEYTIDGQAAGVGDTLSYKITYEKTTEGDPATVVITDTVPDYTQYKPGTAKGRVVSGSADEPTTLVQNGMITWTFKNVTNGTVLEATFEVEVVDDDAPVLKNKSDVKDGDNIYHSNEVVNSKPVKDVFAEGNREQTIDNTLVKKGDVLEYVLTYTNPTEDEVQTVVFSDVLPADDNTVKFGEITDEVGGSYDPATRTVTWNPITLNPGDTAEVSFTIEVTANTGTAIDNQGTAEVDGTKFNTNVTHNPVPEDPHKEVYTTGTTVNIDGQPVSANQELTYKIRYKKTTEEPATAVTLTDTTPLHTTYVGKESSVVIKPDGTQTAGKAAKATKNDDGTTTLEWNFEDIENGTVIEVTFDVKVDNDKSEVLDNQAHVLDGNNKLDSNEVTNSKPFKDVVYTTDTTATIDGETVKPGESLTYKITYSNPHADKTVTLSIEDVIPENTTFVEADNDGKLSDDKTKVVWSEITLAKKGTEGDSITVSFTVTVNDNVSGETLVNDADVIIGNNHYTTNIVTNPTPPKKTAYTGGTDVVVDGEFVQPGQKLDYVIRYTNTSGKKLDKVEITDTIPDYTTYVGNSATHVENITEQPEDGKTGEIKWTFTNLANNDYVEVKFTVEVVDTVSGETVTNESTVVTSENEFTSNETWNPTPPVKDVFEETDAELANTIDGEEVSPGQVLTYSITYKATQKIDKVQISDKIPEHTTYVGGSAKKVKGPDPTITEPADGAAGGGTAEVVWEYTDVPKDTEIVVTFQVKVDVDAGGQEVKNTGDFWASQNGKEITTETNPVTNPVTNELVIKKNLPEFIDHQAELDDGAFANATFTFEITGVYDELDKEGKVVTKDKPYRNTIGLDYTSATDADQEVKVTGIPFNIRELEVTEVYAGNYKVDPADSSTVTATISEAEGYEGLYLVEFKNIRDNYKYKGGVVNNYDKDGHFKGTGHTSDTASGGTQE